MLKYRDIFDVFEMGSVGRLLFYFYRGMVLELRKRSIGMCGI